MKTTEIEMTSIVSIKDELGSPSTSDVGDGAIKTKEIFFPKLKQVMLVVDNEL